MRVVVDANVILSALLAGNLSELIFSPELELFAPDILLDELERNAEEISRRSKLSEEEFSFLVRVLRSKITTIPLEFYGHRLAAAEHILSDHPKDAPYVALTMHMRIPLWTYEERMLNNPQVQTISTAAVRREVSRQTF